MRRAAPLVAAVAALVRGARAYYDLRNLTMWQEAPQPLRPGLHVVVAYASTAEDAAALAWTFVVRGSDPA